MAQAVQDSFDRVVPGAAKHGDTFLAVIQRRTDEAGIGIALTAVKPSRKSDRLVMQGSIVFGNAWKGKRPYTLQVYADPIGTALQAGYQLVTTELSGAIANTKFGESAASKQALIHNDPNTVRQLNGIMQAFHGAVFLPTLEDVVAAAGQSRRSDGFLGA